MGLVLGQVLRDVLMHQGDVVQAVQATRDASLVVTTATGMPARLIPAIASAAPSMNSTRSTEPT